MLNIFINWCKKNNINIFSNRELFFISDRLVLKPDFKLSGNVYVDLIRPEEITESYLGGCEQFSKSYGTIIVIPINIINELDTISKADIEARFQIRL